MIIGPALITAAEMELICKLFLTAVLGGIIGYERESSKRPAGLRTHMLVAMGANIFTSLSLIAFPLPADPSRMAAQIVTGIGFIGAGTVIQMKNKIKGLTTAASLWLTASIGVGVATGYYALSISATLLGFFVLTLTWLEDRIV